MFYLTYCFEDKQTYSSYSTVFFFYHLFELAWESWGVTNIQINMKR